MKIQAHSSSLQRHPVVPTGPLRPASARGPSQQPRMELRQYASEAADPPRPLHWAWDRLRRCVCRCSAWLRAKFTRPQPALEASAAAPARPAPPPAFVANLPPRAHALLFTPPLPHPADGPGLVHLDQRRMDEVLDALPTARHRTALLRALVLSPQTFFQLHPSGQEALFAGLTGDEDPAALRQLLDHLKPDPLTRWVVLHPRQARAPATPPPSPQFSLSLGEAWAEGGPLHPASVGGRVAGRPLPSERKTVARRMGALADGSRVSLHFEEAPQPPLPFGRGRHPSVVSQPSALPVAVGHRSRPEKFAPPFGAPTVPPGWQRALLYDGAADMAYRRSLEELAAAEEARMPLVAPPAVLPGRGTIYRTAAADYFFAAPQALDTPYQSRRLPPSVSMAYGWYKPLGGPAEPMEMVETNPWGSNF